MPRTEEQNEGIKAKLDLDCPWQAFLKKQTIMTLRRFLITGMNACSEHSCYDASSPDVTCMDVKVKVCRFVF